jgi:hypothetical protein
MIKRTLVLVLFFLLLPSTVVCASSLNETRVNISLSNAEGQPLSDVQILLDLYFYEIIAPEQAELRGAFSDECTTDIHGVCSILIGETQDLLLRGTLDFGEYGNRNVEWHGGVLDVPIRINQEVEPSIKYRILFSVMLFLSVVVSVIVQYRQERQ